jgi:hypothetical protein
VADDQRVASIDQALTRCRQRRCMCIRLDAQGVTVKQDNRLERKESNLTEGGRDTNDETLALEDLGDGDLVAGRVLHQLNVRNRVADLDHDGS